MSLLSLKSYLSKNSDEMKRMLLYKLESDFVTDQRSAGGDGTVVASVRPGVAWTRDTKKAFYNNKLVMVSHRVMVYYKLLNDGSTLSEPLEKNIMVASGRSATVRLLAKTIEGYEPQNTVHEIVVSGDTEYTFWYERESQDMDPNPLAFDILSSGTIYWKSSGMTYEKTIEYSLDSGETWVEITSSSAGAQIPVSAGDTVLFRGANESYSEGIGGYTSFSGVNCYFRVKGNIMSLIGRKSFAHLTTISSPWGLSRLFVFNNSVVNANELLLPATTISEGAYNGLFAYCYHLTAATFTLPAEVMTTECYSAMFHNCEALISGPTILGTVCASACCASMFANCYNLTAMTQLPALQLAPFCYRYMFFHCHALRTSTVLSAKTLVSGCYRCMFEFCRSLTAVTCLAETGVASSDNTYYFLKDVASNGVLTKHAGVTWPTGENGIPSTWTTVDV